MFEVAGYPAIAPKTACVLHLSFKGLGNYRVCQAIGFCVPSSKAEQLRIAT